MDIYMQWLGTVLSNLQIRSVDQEMVVNSLQDRSKGFIKR